MKKLVLKILNILLSIISNPFLCFPFSIIIQLCFFDFYFKRFYMLATFISLIIWIIRAPDKNDNKENDEDDYAWMNESRDTDWEDELQRISGIGIYSNRISSPQYHNRNSDSFKCERY